MSEISLTLVVQKLVNKTPTDMAKIAQKNEKITAFGGINFVLDKFDALLGDVIDRVLGIRSTSFGYQYSEIVRALFAVYLCGGDCMEDINLFLRDTLSDRPGTRIPSADTVLRAIEELTTENVTYMAPKSGKSYDFNTAERLNRLLIEPRQVGLDGKAERPQHLFPKALRPHLGLRIGKTPSRVEQHRQRDLG